MRPWLPEDDQRWNWKEILEEKLGKIPNGKAVGEDGVSFELLKQFPSLTKGAMVCMIDRMLRRGTVPEELGEVGDSDAAKEGSA